MKNINLPLQLPVGATFNTLSNILDSRVQLTQISPMGPIKHTVPSESALLLWRGQRWLWTINGVDVTFEAAWNWNAEAMERLRVGKDTVFDRTRGADAYQIFFTWTEVYSGEWSSGDTAREMRLWLRSGSTKILAKLDVDREHVEPSDYLEAKWRGEAGVWPD